MQESASATPGRPRSLTMVQWTSLLLLLLTGTLNYMDRSALSVTNSAIRADLHLDLGQMGILLSAFSWSYALAQLPIGGLIDRYKPRLLLTVGIALWSVAQGLCGFVHNLTTFIWARILLGIGESPQYPTGARVVSDWYPLSKRGAPTGVFNSASPLGTAIAPPILSLVLVASDWRMVFVALGVVGLFVAVLWWATYRNPEEVALKPEDREAISHNLKKSGGNFKAWGNLFRHASTWGMILGFFGSVYLNWLYVTWLPGYLQLARHMDTIHSGFAAFVPFFCGFIGCLIAGWFSDIMVRLTGSAIRGRKWLAAIAMFGMAIFTVPGAMVQDNTLALACISVVIFLANVASTASWALVSAVAPQGQVASLGAVQNFGGYIGGSLAPIVTGYVAKANGGNFVPAMAIGAVIVSLSALAYLFGVNRPIPAGDAHDPA
jgi:MFS family permease